MWIIKIIKIKCFYPPRILNEHLCIYSCLQIPPRENWFQYVPENTQPQLTFLALLPWFNWDLLNFEQYLTNDNTNYLENKKTSQDAAKFDFGNNVPILQFNIG